MKLRVVLCLAAAFAMGSPLRGKDAKITAEEIVAKHLESIGPADARSAVRSRMAEGTTSVRLLVGGTAVLSGRATLYSETGALRAKLRFDAKEYYGEEFTLSGEKTDVGYAQPAQRSPIGRFLASYDEPLREGLLTGTLSTTWTLLDPQVRGAKLKYDGLKKVEGRQLHQVTYQPKKRRSDLRILLFFEAETLRHVRTSYSITVPASVGSSINQSFRQQETRFDLEENFDGFQALDGLTLPTTWSLRFGAEEGSRSSLWKWDTNIERVQSNVTPPPARD